MANDAEVTRGARIGSVLQWEVDGNKQGFCRKTFATVTVAAGMGVGGALGLGAAASAGISGATVLIPIAALALLGAGAGGFSLGKLTGKLVGIFSKWKTRDMLRKQSAGLKRAPQREKPVRIGLGGI